MKNELFSVEQVAKKLDLHPRTIRRFIKEEKLCTRKVGGQWRISGQDIKVFVGDENANNERSTELGDIPRYAREHCVYAVDIIGDPGKSDENRPNLKGPAYAEWLEDVLDALPIFSDEELQRLTMPLLLIAGKQDALLHSEKTAARLKGLLPHLRADLRTNLGHVLLGVADDVSAFLGMKRGEQLLVDTAEAAV